MTNDQSIKNVTDLRSIQLGQLINYSTEELHLLLEVINESYELAKRNKEWLEAAINLKFCESFTKKRIRQGKENRYCPYN